MYLSVDLELEPFAAHPTINTKDLIIVLGRPALLNVLLHQKNGRKLITPRKEEMCVSDLNISSPVLFASLLFNNVWIILKILSYLTYARSYVRMFGMDF